MSVSELQSILHDKRLVHPSTPISLSPITPSSHSGPVTSEAPGTAAAVAVVHEVVETADIPAGTAAGTDSYSDPGSDTAVGKVVKNGMLALPTALRTALMHSVENIGLVHQAEVEEEGMYNDLQQLVVVAVVAGINDIAAPAAYAISAVVVGAIAVAHIAAGAQTVSDAGGMTVSPDRVAHSSGTASPA